MSLFENQLKQREKADNDLFEESFFDVVDSVVGSKIARDPLRQSYSGFQ